MGVLQATESAHVLLLCFPKRTNKKNRIGRYCKPIRQILYTGKADEQNRIHTKNKRIKSRQIS